MLLHCQIIEQLCQICGDIRFKGHKELILNVSRLLSKVSNDYNCADKIIKSHSCETFLDILELYRENSAVLIRISFVLGNLTTNSVEARHEFCHVPDCFMRIIQIGTFYLEKDNAGAAKIKDVPQDSKVKKYEEFTRTSIEDAMTKIIKLLANLSTEEYFAQAGLISNKALIQRFILHLVKAIDKRTIEASEEFILNAISCITNLLFYDRPELELLNFEIRVAIFNSIKLYMLANQNEEIQIETVRVLSNLSRHISLCEEFVTDKTYLEGLMVVLDLTLRDLVYYTVGIIINITLHEKTREKLMLQPEA